MSKANSFKSQPWTQLEKGSYSIFQDDFISEKLTFKTTKKSATSTIALKESFHFSKESTIVKSQQELKLWFPFRDTRTLYLRLKNEGFKLHYDGGVQQSNGYKTNWYGSWQSKRNFTADTYKLGLEVKKDNWSTNFRLAGKPVELGLYIYNKTYFTQNKFSFGLVNVFQPFTNDWLHFALQFGWKDNNNNDFYVRTNTGKKLDTVKSINEAFLNYIYKCDSNNNLGVEVELSKINKDKVNASFIWDHKSESSADTGIKLKADTKCNLAVSVKNSISGFGYYIFGVNLHDFGGRNRVTYGLQLDINI